MNGAQLYSSIANTSCGYRRDLLTLPWHSLDATPATCQHHVDYASTTMTC